MFPPLLQSNLAVAQIAPGPMCSVESNPCGLTLTHSGWRRASLPQSLQLESNAWGSNSSQRTRYSPYGSTCPANTPFSYFFPMGHGPYNSCTTPCSMGCAILYLPWAMGCATLYLPWVMDCTIIYFPWPMGCTTLSISMAHGLYSTLPPMGHGLYNTLPPVKSCLIPHETGLTWVNQDEAWQTGIKCGKATWWLDLGRSTWV